MPIYDTAAPKKPANLSINSDLLAKARESKINLSATLETALISQLRELQKQHWREQNAAAISAYNEFVEREGVFSDGLRGF